MHKYIFKNCKDYLFLFYKCLNDWDWRDNSFQILAKWQHKVKSRIEEEHYNRAVLWQTYLTDFFDILPYHGILLYHFCPNELRLEETFKIKSITYGYWDTLIIESSIRGATTKVCEGGSRKSDLLIDRDCFHYGCPLIYRTFTLTFKKGIDYNSTEEITNKLFSELEEKIKELFIIK
jgi:hypothetical protein